MSQLNTGSLSANGKDLLPKIHWVKRFLYFECKQTTSIDLYDVLSANIDASNGYWGTENGVPREGENIVDAFSYILETGARVTTRDTFYFFITDPIEAYPEWQTGDILALEVTFETLCAPIIEPFDGYEFSFCYGVNVERGSGKTIDSMSVENLLLATATNPYTELLDSNNNWKVDVLKYKPTIVDSVEMSADELAAALDLKLAGPYPFWVQFVVKATGKKLPVKNILITVLPKPVVAISTDPDISDPFREYDPQDKILIKVDDYYKFDSIKYYLNGNYMNKYQTFVALMNI